MNAHPPLPGMAVHLAADPTVKGYISMPLAAGHLGVVTPAGYGLLDVADVVVDGPHPDQWERHAHLRTLPAGNPRPGSDAGAAARQAATRGPA